MIFNRVVHLGHSTRISPDIVSASASAMFDFRYQRQHAEPEKTLHRMLKLLLLKGGKSLVFRAENVRLAHGPDARGRWSRRPLRRGSVGSGASGLTI
jgi:hypothetical protein